MPQQTRITHDETPDGWTIHLADSSFNIRIDEVSRLINHLKLLLHPAERRGKVRAKWKQIVRNSYNLRITGSTRLAEIKEEIGGGELLIAWNWGRHDLRPMFESCFIADLRPEDRDAARQFFERFRDRHNCSQRKKEDRPASGPYVV